MHNGVGSVVHSERDIGVLIRHHCGYRKLKKAALLALPYIINANIVTASWENNVKVDDEGNPIDGDKRQSGMISAPILIDGVKYLCNLTSKKNGKKKVTPYALALKDENGELVEAEKMVGILSSVPHSSSEPTTIGDVHSVEATTSHDTNPSFQGAKVQQNIEISKNNNIKTEQYMNKKLIRLTESDLHRIVKESVNIILKEGSVDKADYENWEQIREMIGDDNMISELWNWLDVDSIQGFIDNIDRNYELGLLDSHRSY